MERPEDISARNAKCKVLLANYRLDGLLEHALHCGQFPSAGIHALELLPDGCEQVVHKVHAGNAEAGFQSSATNIVIDQHLVHLINNCQRLLEVMHTSNVLQKFIYVYNSQIIFKRHKYRM